MIPARNSKPRSLTYRRWALKPNEHYARGFTGKFILFFQAKKLRERLCIKTDPCSTDCALTELKKGRNYFLPNRLSTRFFRRSEV